MGERKTAVTTIFVLKIKKEIGNNRFSNNSRNACNSKVTNNSIDSRASTAAITIGNSKVDSISKNNRNITNSDSSRDATLQMKGR